MLLVKVIQLKKFLATILQNDRPRRSLDGLETTTIFHLRNYVVDGQNQHFEKPLIDSTVCTLRIEPHSLIRMTNCKIDLPRSNSTCLQIACVFGFS